MHFVMTSQYDSFRALHIPGNPFILANAWDLGSAKMLAALGAKALATTSAGHAFTLGKCDMGNVSRDVALQHANDLVTATNLPVSADLENGYGEAPEVVAETTQLAIEAGLAGLCIEDTAIPDSHSYDFALAVERIQAAAAVAGGKIVLVARADGVMLGNYDSDEALRRLLAFSKVGADVLFAPVLPDIETVQRICTALDKPFNVLAAGKFTRYSVKQLAAAGVARISLGSALARVTHQAIYDCATQMFNNGELSALTAAADGDSIDALLKREQSHS